MYSIDRTMGDHKSLGVTLESEFTQSWTASEGCSSRLKRSSVALCSADIACFHYIHFTDIAAIFYNIANSSIDAARGKHDVYGGMAAGAVSGAIFKASGESTRIRAAPHR